MYPVGAAEGTGRGSAGPAAVPAPATAVQAVVPAVPAPVTAAPPAVTVTAVRVPGPAAAAVRPVVRAVRAKPTAGRDLSDAAYAAIRALGRAGIAEIVERCCAHAARLVAGIGELAGAEIVARPIINQGLVRFLGRDGAHDRRTDEVIHRIQAKGVAWFGGTTWRGMRVMRISLVNWATTEGDIEKTIASVREALAEAIV